jgi:beta-glucosidase
MDLETRTDLVRRLPGDFVWGTATASYQIEGAVAEDGRTPSIWDTFSHTPGRVDNGDTGDIACDSYRRWPEDLKMLSDLGVTSYRFSVAWPRIQPEPGGQINSAGLDYYDRMVDHLVAAGIEPMVTLYHWDLPQYQQDRGGWPVRDTAERFADYSAAVAAGLGDRVTTWATINEPTCVAWLGYREGLHAPGIRDVEQSVLASYHLLLGHGLAVSAVRSNAQLPAQIGIVANLSPCRAVSDDPDDIAAARRADGDANRWFLDPIYGHGFPEDMLTVFGVELPEQAGDLEVIATPTDYLGVNYYFPTYAAAAPGNGVLELDHRPPPGRRTAMGWPVDENGLEEILVWASENYQPPAIFVTENGSAYDDVVGADGSIDDPERTAFQLDHLAACARAAERGVPLRGYYAWSLLDNFEWAYGYAKRFGLVRVDYATQLRTMKASGRNYAELIAAHRDAQ